MRGIYCSDCLHEVKSHTQDCKVAITKHIAKAISGQKWRTWKGAKSVCLPRNRVPTDKPRGNPPPLPTCPYQIPIENPTSTSTCVEITTNDANEMVIQHFHQIDASKLQQNISGEKRNSTSPDPGNISQVKDSNIKARKDRLLREGKLIHTKIC